MIDKKIIELTVGRNSIPEAHIKTVCGELLGLEDYEVENSSYESKVVPGLSLTLSPAQVKLTLEHNDYNVGDQKNYLLNEVQSQFSNYKKN